MSRSYNRRKKDKKFSVIMSQIEQNNMLVLKGVAADILHAVDDALDNIDEYKRGGPEYRWAKRFSNKSVDSFMEITPNRLNRLITFVPNTKGGYRLISAR